MTDPEQVIADAIHGARPISVEKFSNDYQRNLDEDAARIARALRAAGLLPGPDEIVVNREALELWMANSGVTWQMLEGDYRKRVAFAGQSLIAALLQPHPVQEQQT